MTTKAAEICRYFRDVLTFRNYIEVPDDNDSYFTISDEELKTGKLKKDDTRRRLAEKWSSEDKKDDDDNLLEIILIPKIVVDMEPKYTPTKTKDANQVWEYKKISLLYIKATLDRKSFEIRNKTGESLVWADPLVKSADNIFVEFFRELFYKIFRKDSQGEMVKFRFKNAPLECGEENWDQYITGVDKHFEKRTGKSLFNSDKLSDEYGNSHNLYMDDHLRQTIVMKDDVVFASKNIESLLHVIENKRDEKLPLFEKMILGNEKRKILNEHKTGENLKNHLGQMKADFPLADAQRDAVHCASILGNGDVLAVSGPPGTGKTTMLQSIVADMVVRMVVNHYVDGDINDEESYSAPLILASSANNKAITNIIDAFGNEDDDTSKVDMFHRWLCYESDKRKRFVPMAVYCPSAYAGRKRISQYFVTGMKGGDDYKCLRKKYATDSSDFCNRAIRALWKDEIFEYKKIEIGKGNSDKEIIGAILAELKYRIGKLHKKIAYISAQIEHKATSSAYVKNIIDSLFLEYNTRESVKRFETLYKDNPESVRDDRESLDRLLDLTLRFDLYWLAVHYNECRWIILLKNKSNKDNEPREVYGKYLWNEIKYICPCVIATFYRAPKLFEFKSKDRLRYNFELADLLIVDEAGQVSPEIGLPTFALAKKALVVGDVKQIPPVYSVPECSEETYWSNRVNPEMKDTERDILSCCRSNVMAISENRCNYERITQSGKKEPGLFLNEHRRCVDEIIDYCNKLIYCGELVPKRGSNTKKGSNLPPLGIYIVESNSELKSGSRINQKEIDAISEWLAQNEKKIEGIYNKRIQELVSIITPFKAQSLKIKEDEYLKKFQSGTVHTFQGAESPIVIFSLVYGANDNPTFIKSNHELMNVAVSRAKDHFIIFGSKKCLENNRKDKACRLLQDKLESLNNPF